MVLIVLLSANQTFSQNYKINERTKIFAEEVRKDSVLLKVKNDFEIPITVKLDLFLVNLIGNSSSPIISIVPAKSSGYIIARFKRINKNIPYKYTYNWKIVPGDISQIPDANYIYKLPFQKSHSCKLSQGPGGLFSHKNIFAYDFVMPVGTPITASRDGIIALVKFDSQIGGPDNKYLDDANFISVFHSDGTFANYFHLNKNGVIVKEGDLIKKGQIIGYSGNTGYSSGPHLHLEILQPTIISDTKKWVEFKLEKIPEYSNSTIFGR